MSKHSFCYETLTIHVEKSDVDIGTQTDELDARIVDTGTQTDELDARSDPAYITRSDIFPSFGALVSLRSSLVQGLGEKSR